MNRGGGWVEKHLLGLFSFSASLCSSPSQNPKITRILARISPHPISLRKEGVGGGRFGEARRGGTTFQNP